MSENLYTPNSIRTVTGRYVNLLNPDPSTLYIDDIAHALCCTPRFGGHLPVFYSAAQHSLEVMHMVPEHLKLQALMHDASEAYLCDLPSPLKALLPEYKVIELRMMNAIALRFGFDWPEDPEVKAADTFQLEREWKEIMLDGRFEGDNNKDWKGRVGLGDEEYMHALRSFRSAFSLYHKPPHHAAFLDL